ncbi:MAG TPA: ATP-binding cassette domain-containing protein [Sphingobacteriaceae bacterium]|nr:ATP-binding cassette domain-containing protein [Sphingobacteriaceae bacterium]
MLEVRLEKIGRRFNREWIFRDLEFEFVSGTRHAVLGPNGSGKSTLLKLISGSLTPSEGQIHYFLAGKTLPVEHLYRQLSLAAPYLELIEEFTLREVIRFHFSNKSYLDGFDEDRMVELIGLEKSLDKPLRFFSSGMKQRVKLALACCADTALVLLDEPTSNLDVRAIQWYHELLEKTINAHRLLLVFSNQPEEYKTCEKFLTLGIV